MWVKIPDRWPIEAKCECVSSKATSTAKHEIHAVAERLKPVLHVARRNVCRCQIYMASGFFFALARPAPGSERALIESLLCPC